MTGCDTPYAGGVIKGWDEGVRSMKKGELAVLTCRSGRAPDPVTQYNIFITLIWTWHGPALLRM